MGFEQINKAKTANDALAVKKEKERERLKKEKMAKRGLKPKKIESKSNEPVNILEEIKMKKAKGTLSPSKAKKDIVGYEKVQKIEGRPKKDKNVKKSRISMKGIFKKKRAQR